MKHFRCGGIFNHHCITNLLLSQRASVKELLKSVSNWWNYEDWWLSFLDHLTYRPYYCGARRLCVCVRRAVNARRISLGGEGNALYPVLSSCYKCTASGLCAVSVFKSSSQVYAGGGYKIIESSFELLDFLLDWLRDRVKVRTTFHRVDIPANIVLQISR